uniref:Uncharacterized protein n=1 Tax=Panagrolaimus sp. JU765 TaxID=591449 RepID=A0AC34QVS5_9BILA
MSTIIGGLSIGVIAIVFGIIIPGVGFTIAGAIGGGIAIGGSIATGGTIISKSANTNINDERKEVLEACFVRQLVEQKIAMIEDGELYLTIDN